MTLKPFLRFLLAFCVLYIFMIAAVVAAPKWKDEVGISSWCYDLKTIKDIVQAEVSGNPEVGEALATKAFKERKCVRLPIPAAAFKPSGVEEKYPSFGGKPVTLIKGNLVQKDESLGRVVYVLIPDSLLGSFQITEGAIAPIEGPKYTGQQDV